MRGVEQRPTAARTSDTTIWTSSTEFYPQLCFSLAREFCHSVFFYLSSANNLQLFKIFSITLLLQHNLGLIFALF